MLQACMEYSTTGYTLGVHIRTHTMEKKRKGFAIKFYLDMKCNVKTGEKGFQMSNVLSKH